MKKIFTIIASFLFSALPALAQLKDTSGLEAMTNAATASSNLTHVSIGHLMANIISIVLSLLAIIFLILTIYSGIRWMTSEGNEEAIAKSKKTLTSSIIGLIIVLSAYAITYFVFKNLPIGGGMTAG